MPNNLVFNNVASQLQTQIFGSDGTTQRAVRTDANGILLVAGTFSATVAKQIVETCTTVTANTAGTALTIETTGLSDYSFYVFNSGTETFTVKLQISPDSSNSAFFIDDMSGTFTIDSVNTKAVLVPRYYMKYTRLVYVTTAPVTFTAWFNGMG